MCAIMLALTFGHALSPRPGQLLSIMHPSSPIKCTVCKVLSCPGNALHKNARGQWVITSSHHKNSGKTGQPIPTLTIDAEEPLSKLLSFYVGIAFPIWRSGSVCSDVDAAQQWHLFLDQDGGPFSLAGWRSLFKAMCMAVSGVAMTPMLAR